MTTIIDSYVSQHEELTSFLSGAGEISLKADADKRFTKILILACASYFEDRVVTIVEDFSRSVSGGNEAIQTFVRKKGLDRQYHTLFDWSMRNANRFFSYFGERSKDKHKNDIKDIELLSTWEADYMYLGRTRNVLVHTNFAIANVDDTYVEVYERFKSAISFVNYVEQHLGEMVASRG